MAADLARSPLAALDAGWVLATLLLSLRLAGLLLFTPLLQAFGVPATVRVLLVLGLAAALASGLPAAGLKDAAAWGAGRLAQACLTELALGATLGLGIHAAFAAASLAGRLLDLQVGFGIGQVFDAATLRQVPVLTSAFNLLAAAVFFLADGHHALLRAVAAGLQAVPPGAPWSVQAAAPHVFAQAGSLFVLAFALAAPVVLALLLVELALGVVARHMPQMNVFMVGLPVKLAVGLLALALWAPGLGAGLGRVQAGLWQSWAGLFDALATGVR